ncbi:hypothetical protein NVS55_27785 [Myxococcus stipitatus]|uniref:hypothetical protein n=1 Tax=Myxococcus stipitatus TaxID=83455 RepID=UPI0031454C1D
MDHIAGIGPWQQLTEKGPLQKTFNKKAQLANTPLPPELHRSGPHPGLGMCLDLGRKDDETCGRFEGTTGYGNLVSTSRIEAWTESACAASGLS